MAKKLTPFKVRFTKVTCRSCNWPLAREFQTGDGFRLEIRVSRTTISISGWPDFIQCGRCGSLNTPDDLKAHRSAIEETNTEPATVG